MLNIKRLLIASALFFGLSIITVACFVSFSDINDYSDWITEQLKQRTGYDVRFEQFENNWLAELSLTIKGLALYQQDQRVVYIKELDFQVDKLDLWQRELEIQLIKLKGVEVNISQPLQLVDSHFQHKLSSESKVNGVSDFFWEKLHISRVQLIDLNISLQKEGQKLRLKEGEIELNDLLVINQKQLQTIPADIDLSAKFNALQLNDGRQSVLIDDFILSAQADISERHAKLNIGAKLIQLKAESYPDLKLGDLQLVMQFDEDKLLLEKFSIDAFSGSLMIKGDALLDLSLFPQPKFKVKGVTLQSLLAKNMQFTIPAFTTLNNKPQKSSETSDLPIEALLIKNLQLENMSLNSTNDTLPLSLKALSLQLINVSPIKNNQWLDLSTNNENSGSFSLAFDRLNWEKTEVEQFSIIGGYSEDDPGLQTLRKLLPVIR